jgi:6-phosphogluconolactonase
MSNLHVRSIRIADSAEVPRVGAEWIAQQLEQAIAERGFASLALSGGHTPRRVYEELASLDIPWDRVGVFFGDERCVPPDDPDSNFRMAREALFDRVQGLHVHRMPADRADLESAATEYARELPEALDAMVLGMGEDGHTASLFPGHDWSHSAGRKVIVVNGAPKPPPRRMSVTPEVIWAARARLVLATGAAKAPQIVRALEGEPDPTHYPVHVVRGATWLLDEAAASLLSEQRYRRAT